MNNTPVFNTALVVFNNGAFGGAAKRETLLFLHLHKLFPGKFFLIVNQHLFNQVSSIIPELPFNFIHVVKQKDLEDGVYKSETPKLYKDILPDPYETDLRASVMRKLYWYYKNRLKQYLLFLEIEKFRKKNNIKVFNGVFSGILPLVFYSKNKKVSVVFSDMDSWFSDVHTDMKKFWYRKYYSFNYALENSDLVDFLSPYIVEGIKERGVKIKKNKVVIAPCSFADYEKCKTGNKQHFQIAFSARLEPDKNPLLFLEAAKILLKMHPHLIFHIMGEGSLVNDVGNFIKSNCLGSNIKFSFQKNPADILENTSVFVSLQANTNYPSQSVLEAMACGNAVIASDCGDTGLFINKDNGLLIPLNVDSLIEALKKMINDPGLTQKLGINGREMVLKNHTIERYTEYYLGIINLAYKEKFITSEV